MTDQETAPPAPSVPARPRLNLKPRDPEAVARMEAERQASIGKVRCVAITLLCRGSSKPQPPPRLHGDCWSSRPIPARAQSPFGNAKPREAVIAGRVGKTEEEVLREEVKSTYKLHVRLLPWFRLGCWSVRGSSSQSRGPTQSWVPAAGVLGGPRSSSLKSLPCVIFPVGPNHPLPLHPLLLSCA